MINARLPSFRSVRDRVGTRVRVAFLGVSALALFAWCSSSALNAFYTADDFVQLAVSVPTDFRHALAFFHTDWGGAREGGVYYRPIVNVSLWLNASLTGLSPASLRLSGLGIHLLVAVLVGVIARYRLLMSPELSTLAGAFFLLLPLHDQAIFWIAARTDLLCAFFYAIAFLALTHGSLSIQLVGCVAFGAALGSKEMAVTLPAVLALWWAVRGMPEHGSALPAVRPLAMATAIVGVYIALRLVVLGSLGGDPRLFAVNADLTGGVLTMLSWSILPFDLERVRDFARVHRIVIGPVYLLAAAILYIAVRRLWRKRLAWFAIGWILLTMVPVVASPNAWYAYIPSIGGSLLLALFCQQFPRRQLSVGLIIVVMAALSLRAGAERMAEAGRLSEMLVHAGTRAGRDVFVVNSPNVLKGRYVVVTDQSHFDAASRVLRLPQRTVSLNFAYIETVDDPRLAASWTENRIVAAADVGRRTFLTLDGTGVADSAAAPGITQAGRLATYAVLEMQRGHIASLEMVPSAEVIPSATFSFEKGQLVLVPRR